jgi:methionine-rich copper-binding protein CopC
MKKFSAIIFFLLVIPSLAYPHAYLIETHPEEATTLTESPHKVSLHFLGFLEHFFSKVEVYDSEGSKVSNKTKLSDGEDGTVMVAELINDLNPGEYTVKWICISKDGHSQNDSYTFTVK